MYEYIKGYLAELTPTCAIVETAGIGYYINISVTTYSSLKQGQECLLFLQQIIREDAHLLFGFATKLEREIFNLLITVSGIGANTARLILSSLTPQEVISAISSGNENTFNSVKGIGKKTAQRIGVDLHDKVANLMIENMAENAENFIAPNNTIQKDALLTLTTLGFSKPAVEKVLNKIMKENSNISLEEVIKLALNYL